MRFLTILPLLILVGLLAACDGGGGLPTINNSGDGNVFNIPGDEGTGSVVTPAPVIVEPVVIVPAEAEEE